MALSSSRSDSGSLRIRSSSSSTTSCISSRPCPGLAVTCTLNSPATSIAWLYTLTLRAICFSYTSVRYRRELLPSASTVPRTSSAASSSSNAGVDGHTR